MCALQLDPQFKVLQCVMEYVYTKTTTSIVRISPTSVPVPLLMKASKHLDPKLIE